MNWGYFFAWCVAIIGAFFITGWPVSPSMKNVWGNHYNDKNLTYYTVLYFHYLLGALFFTFLVLGLFRGLIWKGDKDGNRQIAFLLAYSTLTAAANAVYFTHKYSPVEDDNNSDTGDDVNITTPEEAGANNDNA